MNFGVIMMFINCSKCTTQVGHIDTGETVNMWWQRIYGKSLCLELNCAVTLNFL